jgi:hypothetical protein
MPVKLPAVAADINGNQYFIAPFASGVRLSMLSLFFVASCGFVHSRHAHSLLSYSLALPSVLGRQKGDFSPPLLQETLLNSESRFPQLILAELSE